MADSVSKLSPGDAEVLEAFIGRQLRRAGNELRDDETNSSNDTANEDGNKDSTEEEDDDAWLR